MELPHQFKQERSYVSRRYFVEGETTDFCIAPPSNTGCLPTFSHPHLLKCFQPNILRFNEAPVNVKKVH